MFSLFISEMKFSFDGIKISVRNLYTEKLYGKGMQEGISETPFRKINIRRYNMNGSLKQNFLPYVPAYTFIHIYIYIYITVFLFMRQRVIMQKFSMGPYTRQNIRGQIYGGPFRNL